MVVQVVVLCFVLYFFYHFLHQFLLIPKRILCSKTLIYQVYFKVIYVFEIAFVIYFGNSYKTTLTFPLLSKLNVKKKKTNKKEEKTWAETPCCLRIQYYRKALDLLWECVGCVIILSLYWVLFAKA